MLTVTNLTAGYGPITALDDVSFTARRGEITAILGANGAGKTTLLRTLSGLHPATSGTIEFEGAQGSGGTTRLDKTRAERMPGLGLSQVPEGRGVITELSVEENLRLGALGRSGRPDKDALDNIYEMFPPLAERRKLLANTLSGGERQMLVIGRAMMATPTMLLLDEPSLGLAPRIVAQIFELLRDLVSNEGLTVLLVEQNARSALSVADHGIVLNLGKVVADEAASTLADDEQLRHAYLGF